MLALWVERIIPEDGKVSSTQHVSPLIWSPIAYQPRLTIFKTCLQVLNNVRVGSLELKEFTVVRANYLDKFSEFMLMGQLN